MKVAPPSFLLLDGSLRGGGASYEPDATRGWGGGLYYHWSNRVRDSQPAWVDPSIPGVLLSREPFPDARVRREGGEKGENREGGERDIAKETPIDCGVALVVDDGDDGGDRWDSKRNISSALDGRGKNLEELTSAHSKERSIGCRAQSCAHDALERPTCHTSIRDSAPNVEIKAE